MFLDKLKLITQNPKLSLLLYKSMKNYKDIEIDFEKELKTYSFYDKMSFPYKNLNEKQYFERNFFSSFFISIFKTLDFTDEEIKKYGMIFHLIRVIITCTDNIIDKEENGPVIFNAKLKNEIKNILILLISNNLMSDYIKSKKAKTLLLEVIYKIAYGESMAKVKDYDNYPSEDFIINEIHFNIGGELLGIAFEAPIADFDEKKETIKAYQKAVIEIGLSLQSLDDMSDIIEDIADDKSNLMISKIIKNNNITYRELINYNEKDFDKFQDDYYELINYSVEKALNGFKIMEDLGYSINEKQSLSILELMFKLRGLEDKWNIYKKGR